MCSRWPPLAPPVALPRLLHRVGGVEDHRCAGGRAQPLEVSHVDHEVAVAEEGAALGHRHVARCRPLRTFSTAPAMASACDPLPLLHVHRPAGAAGGDEQVGLPAEKRRDLERVRHLGRRRRLRRPRGCRSAPATRSRRGPARAREAPLPGRARAAASAAGAVGLVEARLEADRNARAPRRAWPAPRRPAAGRRPARPRTGPAMRNGARANDQPISARSRRALSARRAGGPPRPRRSAAPTKPGEQRMRPRRAAT